MADAYGSLVAAMSDDCNCDVDGLCKALGQYEWCNNGGQWVVQDGKLWFEEPNPQFPSVYVGKIIGCDLLLANGEEQFIPIAEATEDDWANGEALYETVALREHSEQLTRFIRTGKITLAAVCTELSETAFFNALELHADGKIVYRWQFVSCDGDDDKGSDKYEPTDEEKTWLALNKV